MRDALDDVMFEHGHELRRDAEASVDADAALLDHAARMESVPLDAEPSQSRWTWYLAAAAVLAVVAVGAVLLVRDENSLQTDEPPATADTIDTVPGVVTPPAPVSTTAPTQTPITPPTPVTTGDVPSTTLEHEGPPPSTVPPHTRGDVNSGIARSCTSDDVCTQVVADPTGTIVSFDPVTRLLTRHSIPEVSATIPFEGDVFLVAAGPDGAVYMLTPTSDSDPVGDLVAVSLTDDDAGREIDRAVGEADLSGDSDLVATTEGLVRVGCCGGDQARPAPDSPVVMTWVGPSAGEPQPTSAISVDGTGLVTVGDRTWQVELGDGAGQRGMPPITATFDGGFVGAFDYVELGTVLARGWPDGTVSQIEVSDYPALLEPTGRVLYASDDEYVRGDPFESPEDVRIEWGLNTGPDGEWLLNPYTVNDDIDATQPVWAADPVAWGDTFGGVLDPGATRTVTTTAPGDDVTVTVVYDNSLDSTLRATRFVLDLTRGSDGLYRFVSGTYDIACWPDHGHQDFQPQNCF